jgi:hypothetical protein
MNEPITGGTGFRRNCYCDVCNDIKPLVVECGYCHDETPYLCYECLKKLLAEFDKLRAVCETSASDKNNSQQNQT